MFIRAVPNVETNSFDITYPFDPRRLETIFRGKVSFPRRGMSEELLAEYHVYRVVEVDRPQGDVVTELVPALEADKWVQRWDSRDFTADEIAEQEEREYRDIINHTRKRLEMVAKERGYDNMATACSYANSTDPKYKAEGDYCVALRDATWKKIEEIDAEVKAATRFRPKKYSDIENELPEVSWPT